MRKLPYHHPLFDLPTVPRKSRHGRVLHAIIRYGVVPKALLAVMVFTMLALNAYYQGVK